MNFIDQKNENTERGGKVCLPCGKELDHVVTGSSFKSDGEDEKMEKEHNLLFILVCPSDLIPRRRRLM